MKLYYLFAFVSTIGFGQSSSELFKSTVTRKYTGTDVRNEIISYDISPLLTKTDNAAVFGFIGKDYERIKIKFISVIKNSDQQDHYLVFGKSMVKENICEFQGTIKITNAYYGNDPDIKDVKQGVVVGDYTLYENPSQKHVGLFKGTFQVYWYIDKEGKINYDDLMSGADGFGNNYFVGTWTDYSTGLTKPCHWGDYRISMDGDLDIGAGEFSPNKKYINNGWTSYLTAFGGASDKQGEEARKKERSAWWK